ncbi:hypothetical protein [Ruegeria faecimaris]|uniref:bestrophin-like domain n=1 Tax=Ruegeria faecimaris TaxID=686389 RepID=UPI00232C1BEE|nr:hypothetical protein [Ruegeria faecimaris]
MTSDYLWIWPIGFALLVGGGHYLLRPMYRGPLTDETKDFLATAGFRIGSLHALVASLAFSTIIAEQNELIKTAQEEALAIERLYLNLSSTDRDEHRVAREELVTYIEQVLTLELPLNVEEVVSDSAGRSLRRLDVALKIASTDHETENRWAFAFEDYRMVVKARGQRSFDSYKPLPVALKFVLLLGFLGTLACMIGFRASPAISTGIAAFSAINGAVIGALWISQYPFSTHISSISAPFHTVYDRSFLNK